MDLLIAVLYTASVVFLFLLLIFFILFLTASLVSATTNIPFVGSRRRKIRSLLAHAEPEENQIFFDLGSGDGRVVFEAARTFNLKATGVEINPLLILFSNLVTRIWKIKNVSFIRDSALNVSLKKAHIIYVFLLPKLLIPLAKKFKNECKPGTIIISHGFQIKGFKSKLFKKVEDTPFSTYYYKL